MPTFTFDQEKHIYAVDGVRIPSVTQILKLAGLVDYDGIPQAVLDYAAQRGTAVHLACQFWDEGTLNRESLDPIILPYLSAWQNFVVDHPFEILESEQKHLGEIGGLQYGMTLDRLVKMQGRLAIIDIKCTRNHERHHAIQTAGYAIGLESGNWTVAKRLSRYWRLMVQLKPDGSYTLYEYSNSQDGEIFAAALKVAHWKMASIRSQMGPTT